MRNKILFLLSILGAITGIFSAYLFSAQKKPLPPVFNPAPNPYPKGVYANGIIESYQSSGENINIYPEVTGVITQILVTDGQSVHRGEPIFLIDDSVQKALTEQQKSQADAALSVLNQLKAQPRKENLEVAKAQVEYADSSLKNAQDQLAKFQHSYKLNPQSVSQNTLDNAVNAVRIAQANLNVMQKQYELTRAGAWIYDIRNQESQWHALQKAYLASMALLDKYTVRAPTDGVILSIRGAVGSYVSSQGVYGTYTQSLNPVMVMGWPQNYISVRCYIDEILIPKLPPPAKMKAQMFVRGTNTSIPLQFERVQPYVTPKIELSNQRTERVDVRVLPVVFRFEKPADMGLYPGQLVDVYIGGE